MVTCSAVCRHRRHQGHRRGAAADHDHALAGIVDVVGPFLRMDDAALEALLAGKLRQVACLVVVVAAAHPQEAAGEAPRDTIGAAFDLDGPARVRRRPRGGNDLVAVADPLHRCRGRSRPRGYRSGSRGRRRSPWPPSTAGRSSPACTCRSRSARRDSGTGPRCRRSPRAPRGWRSSCPGTCPAGARRRRCRRGRRRRSARRDVLCLWMQNERPCPSP